VSGALMKQHYWLWIVMDYKTRQRISWHLSKTDKDAQKAIKKRIWLKMKSTGVTRNAAIQYNAETLT